MNHNMRKKWAGVLAGVMLLCGTASASTGLQTLKDVKVGGITIVVNGQKLTPTDANGKVVEPILYQGTTYLPVRAVAGAFDQAVSWDGKTQTVYLGTMGGTLETPTSRFDNLSNISYYNSYFKSAKDMFDNYGGFYSTVTYPYSWSSASNYEGKAWYETLLDKKYSTFKATIFVEKGESDGGTSYLTFIGDDKILYTTEEMDKADAPIEIEVDLTGVNDFKIITTRLETSIYGPQLYIANEGFYQ